MKSILLLSALFILTSCDQPQLNRSRGYLDPFTAQGVDASRVDTNGFDESEDLGEGYSNCNFGIQRSTLNRIRDISVCANSNNSPNGQNFEIKTRFSDQDYIHGTCFVPNYKEANGNSTYVGIAQCTYHASGDTLTGTLVKNRPGYTDKPINSLMIMKKDSLDAYFDCMDAVAEFIQTQSVVSNGQKFSCSFVKTSNCSAYPSPQYQVCNLCMSGAVSEMNNKCSAFQNNHEYINWNL